tara:strand:- start:1504 stop:2283 length:780 start_codon:yes stop_codon:yes gene_type:complete
VKKLILILSLLETFAVIGQKPINTNLIKKEKFSQPYFVGVDRFESIYYLKGDALEKKMASKLQSYSNLQLGDIDQVHIFNALKISVLHKNFNTVVLLDNRMAEINIIDFNNQPTYRLVTEIAYANESALWLYNALNLQLELFDYKTLKTKLSSLPFDCEVLALQSDYNNVFALTASELYHYNYNGSLISKIRHNGFEDFKLGADFIIFRKGDLLFYKKNNKSEFEVLKTGKKIIKQFFVMDQTLYIYDGEFLYHYQLKI